MPLTGIRDMAFPFARVHVRVRVTCAHAYVYVCSFVVVDVGWHPSGCSRVLMPLYACRFGQAAQEIAALMVHHRTAIDELRELVKDSVPADGWDGHWLKYDDLFYLRYILSFGHARGAAEHVRRCFCFRRTPEAQARSAAAVRGDLLRLPGPVLELAKYQKAAVVDGQQNGGHTAVLQVAATQFRVLNAMLTKADLVEAHLSYREAAYQRNDELTRKTGRLVKEVILLDMQGTGLSELLDRKVADVQSTVGKIAASVYPQLQDALGR